MKPYSIYGIELIADEDGRGAFDCFNPDSPNATDRGPNGMVEEMGAFIRLTVGMKSFLDVGALFGIFSLMFTDRPGTWAYAIEPSDMAFPILCDHILANDRNIQPLNEFAGDVTGTIVDCARDWKHVVANLNRDTERLQVVQKRIDDMRIPKIDCMKIDVEGYECQVLRGAEQLIRKWKPIIFLEAHCATLPDNGETPESLMDILRSFKYHVRDYQGNPVNSFDGYSMTRAVCWPIT